MGRKINDYPVESIGAGDKLIGSNEQGRTKNFAADAIGTAILNNLAEGLVDGWVLGAESNKVTEAFMRTDYTSLVNDIVFEGTVNTINVTTPFANAVSVNDRIVISNQDLKFLTTVSSKGANSVTLTDSMTQSQLDSFKGLVAGYAVGNTGVTGYLQPVTTFHGNIEAPNLKGLTPEDEAAIADAVSKTNDNTITGDNTFSGVNTFSNSKGIQTDRISESGGSGVASVATTGMTLNPFFADIGFIVNAQGSQIPIFSVNPTTSAVSVSATTFSASNGIAREVGGDTTDGLKVWSGTEAQYITLGTGRDQNTVYYLTDI